MAISNDRAAKGGLFSTQQRTEAAAARVSPFATGGAIPQYKVDVPMAAQDYSGVVDDDLLSLSYPAFAPRIKQARDKGFSDEEIERSIGERRESALAAGFTDAEVDTALGVTQSSRRNYIKKVLAGRDNADAILLGMTPQELSASYEQARKAGVSRAGAELFTSRQRMAHDFQVSQLADYVDIAEENEKKRGKNGGPVLSLPKGADYTGKAYPWSGVQSDVGPRFEWNEALNDAVASGTKSVYHRTLGGMMVGYLASVEGMVRGGAWLSHVAGWHDGYDKAANLADLIADGDEGLSAMNYADNAPNLWDSFMQGVGSNAAYMMPGVFASRLMALGQGARRLTVAGRFVGTLANVTGATISATSEALSEAGSVFEDVIKRTGDEDAASSGAAWTFWLNMPLNYVTDKMGFFGEDTFLRGFIPKIAKASPRMQTVLYRFAKGLAGAASEGPQETLQGTISEHYGQGTDWSAIDMSQIAFEQGIPGALVGAVFGAGMAHGTFKQMAERVDAEAKIKAYQAHAKDVSSVYAGVRDALKDTKYDEQTRKAYAAIWAGRASSAAKEQGITPMEWYLKQGLTVQQLTNSGAAENVAESFNQNSFQKKQIKETMRNWASEVDRIFDAPNASQLTGSVRVMDTPLVLSLVGGNYTNGSGKIGISINEAKILKIQNDHSLSRHEVKQLPKALADPIAIFESSENVKGAQTNDVVFMLDLKDEHGANVVAAVWLDQSKNGLEFNRLASYYGKDTTDKSGKLIPKNRWFYNQSDKGHLMYINTKKALHWAASGLLLPSVDPNGELNESVPTEKDLVKLLKDNPTYNQTSSSETNQNAGPDLLHLTGVQYPRTGMQSGPENLNPGQVNEEGFEHKVTDAGLPVNDASGEVTKANVTFDKDSGAALVKLFETADRSSFLHESGHIFLSDWAEYIGSGKAAAQDMTDWNVFLDWTGVKSWENATAEEKTRAHEMFARGMEAYFWEGKSPSPALERVFKKFAGWLRDIYRSADELDVQMNDDVRKMFDHLFGMEDAGEVALQTITSDEETFNQTGKKAAGDQEGEPDAGPAAEDASTEAAEDWKPEDLTLNDDVDAVREGDEDAALNGDADALQRLSMSLRKAPEMFTVEQKENIRKAKEQYIDGLNSGGQTAEGAASTQNKDELKHDETAPNNKKGDFDPEVRAYDELVSSILANGGLLYEGLKAAVGPDKARAVWQSARNLIKKSAPALADLAAKLNMTPEEIADKVLNRPDERTFRQFYENPLVYVNNDSYIWLVNRMGHERAEKYLQKRAGLLQAMIASYDDNLRKEQNSKYKGHKGWAETFAYLKEQAKRELSFIQNKALVDVQDELKAGRGINAPAYDKLGWMEFSKYAAKQESELADRELKGTTGPDVKDTKLRDLVAERAHAKRMKRIMTVLNREAFRAGSQSAAMFVRQKNKAYEKKMQDRAEVHGTVDRLLREIQHSTSGELRCDAKQKIQDVLDHYNLKFGGYFQMPGDKMSEYNKKLISVRDEELAELREYLKMDEAGRIDNLKDAAERAMTFENGEVASEPDMHTYNLDSMTEDLAELSQKMLCEMTIKDIQDLHEAVTEIRKQGLADYAAWKEQGEQEMEAAKKPLVEAMGGMVGNDPNAVVIPGRTVRGKDVKAITKALIQTLNPSRVFDQMDDFADFRGAWHSLFKRRADNAEDSFLRNKNRRVENMKRIMQTFGVTEQALAETRLNYKGQDGQETAYSLDDCLFIYAGFHNRFTKDALVYGNHITEDNAQAVFKALSENEKNFAAAVCKETADESGRYAAVMRDVYNVSITNEPWYTRMYRSQWTNAGGETIDEGIKGVLNDVARQYGLRKLYADRGSSYSRKMIPMAYQEPISIGLMNVWNRSMVEHEHLTAYGKLVRQLHAVIGEKTDYLNVNPIVGMKEAIANRYGTDVSEFLLDYVNTLANPDFYKSFKLFDKSLRAFRANLGIAYLWGNISSTLKQPTALAYYLQDSDLRSMTASMAEFVHAPHATMEKVWAMDPQVKEQQMNMFLEMLKASSVSSKSRLSPRNQLRMKKFEELGFKPMELMDMMTRVIGWNAVYKHELSKGASQEEAAYRAQLVTLNTQNAVHPKELPMYMKNSSELALMGLQFTNQASKIFGVTAHDLYGDIKKGRGKHGFMTLMGLLLSAFFMSWLETGKVPDTPAEIGKDIVAEQVLGNIPLLGAGIEAAATKFQGGATPFDTIGQDAFRTVSDLYNGKVGGAILDLYSCYALAFQGLPITAIKRTVKFAQTGEFSDLTGLFRESGKKAKEKRTFIP